MTTRRQLLHAFAAVFAAFPALARQPRVRRIGFLGGGSAASNAAWLTAFREGMTALRWVEERDYVIDARYANGVAQALGGLAAELAASQPELLLTTGEATARQLAQRAKAVPIVFAIAQDPVGNGFAASLQRPGGNMTGLTSVVGDLGPKRLQLLEEAFPRISRVALLFSADNVSDACACAPAPRRRPSPE